uniref:Uncharacterized protein n=1 Tax=Arundo donax TaxID=35708 RepID=A0A0A9CGE4_ARUDO
MVAIVFRYLRGHALMYCCCC